MEIEEDRIRFRMFQKVFENIINICNEHNKQSLELDVQYNHPTSRALLTSKLDNRNMYLDIYVKTQLASLKDMLLYFNNSFKFGYTKFIDIDNLIISCNNELRRKFDKYMFGNEIRFEVQTYLLF
jgi:hypothetical protein